MTYKNKFSLVLALTFLTASSLGSISSAQSMIFATGAGGSVDKVLPDNKKIVGSIVITNKPEEALGFAKSQGLNPSEVLKKAPGKPALVVLSELPDNPKLQALKARKDVKIVPNYSYKATSTPNDPYYPDQWNLPKIKAPEAWGITTGSAEVTVAVLDSGILFTQNIDGTTYVQPDFPENRRWMNPGESGMTQIGDICWNALAGAENKETNNCDDDDNGYIDDIYGWDFMGGYRGDGANCPNYTDGSEYQSSSDPTYVLQDNDPQPYSCDSPSSPNILNKDHHNGDCEAFVSACFVGHGTMVASVIAAQTNNNQLIAGLDYNTKLMNVRVLDGYGYTTTARLVASIYYAAENGADVINMSLGTNCDNSSFKDSLMEDALAAAASEGTVMVAASGNDGWEAICYPASNPNVMAVGASDINDNRISYSNYGSKLDVVAPAEVPVANAPSARINSNYYPDAGGTSLSTPHVAALASLIKGQNINFQKKDIEKIIKERSDKVYGMRGGMYHHEYGYGRINMQTSLKVTQGTLPIYRLYRASTKSHFYTASASERDNAVKDHGFRYEGVSFWSAKSSTDRVPIYRLYRASTKSHFYTASASERDNAVKNHGFRYEGVSFWVRKGTINVKPIYRLYRLSTKIHFYTASASERDNAVKNHGFRYEGIGFYVD